MCARFGDALKFAGPEQRTFTSGFLSATPDGLVVTDDDCFLIECKTADPRTKLDGPKPSHAFQVQVQMGLVRELTNFAPARAIISYSDASFWNEGAEFTIAFDSAIYEIAKQRAAAIITALAFDELSPKAGLPAAVNVSGARSPRPAVASARAFRIRWLQRQIRNSRPRSPISRARRSGSKSPPDATAAELRTAQYEIRERMRARGVRRIVSDGVAVTWSPVKGRQSFDMRRIREAAATVGIDLAEYETVGEATDRLVVTITPHDAP